MNKLAIIGISLGAILLIVLFFFGCERIDAGNVGIKVNNAGGDRGVSKTEYVTGWVPYNRFLTRVYEFPTFQQHKDYEPFVVPAKGGTIFTVHPSFNYNINAGEVGSMFQRYRLSLKQLEEGYLANAVRVEVREVTNTFTPDSILNNMVSYDASIVKGLNTKLAPYFNVSTFTANLTPDATLAAKIAEKAASLQNAIKLQNDQVAIKIQAENDIIGARRDSAVLVIAAQGEARAIKEKQQVITAEYVEYQRVLRWNGVTPTTVAGGSSSFLMDTRKN